MGSPACRISDQTAHGGVIVMGFPTVLIGGLPASRIGDNHVCPMVTGVVPHVGGPFILGSFTVLVGNMPQSRVGDTLICVGPPDVAILGEMTVLVGMAGAGGMAGASTGMQMSGFSPPAAPAAPPAVTATALPTGGTQLAAPPGMSLPPMTVKQPGWPELPASQTVNFQSVQPVLLQQGMQLMALADDAVQGANPSYWMPALPPDAVAQVQKAAQSEWNSAKNVVTAVVQQADGVKAWAGQAAQKAESQIAGAEQQAQQAASQIARQGQQAASQAMQQAKGLASSVPQIWAPASSMAQNIVRSGQSARQGLGGL